MLTTAMKRLPARWSSTTLPSTPVGSTWSRSRSACCAASASTAESTTQTGSAAKSTPGNDNETPPAPASNGCSQPTKPAPKWAAPIPSHPKSHNHCDEVLEHRDVFQQRNHAEDDHDDTRHLLGAAVDRQQVDQVENENNDQKRDQRTDKHSNPLHREKATLVPPQRAARFRVPAKEPQRGGSTSACGSTALAIRAARL